MSGLPQWATPARRNVLVRLYTEAEDFLEQDGEIVPSNIDTVELAIYIWKGLDREERSKNWAWEKHRLHAAPRIIRRGPFGTIDREEYLAKRPLWQIKRVGIGALTFRMVAQVRIPGLDRDIWVSLAGLAKALGVKKKKLLRYKAGAIPREEQERVYNIVRQAVQRELAK